MPTDQQDFNRIRRLMGTLSEINTSKGMSARLIFDEDDTWMSTLASDDAYLIVAASYFAAERRAFIDVHAGGAYGMQPDRTVFEALASAWWRFDYGGPWARVFPDGAAFGWRMRLPSELYDARNEENALGFTTALVHLFADACTVLASELLPRFGGKLIRADDPNAWPPLISGYTPPRNDADQTYRPSQPAESQAPASLRPANQSQSNAAQAAGNSCPNQQCTNYRRPIEGRQCPLCHHYASGL